MPTDTIPTTNRTTGRRRARRLPEFIDMRMVVAGWISFITEVMIIGTGGAVRLTGSGLGCEWPLCAPDSLVPLPGMGLHSYIEFGNRMMSGVVGIAALLVLVTVWRIRRQRRDLFAIAWIVVGGILLQAAVGGITVLADLNAGVVSFHFVASLVLVCLTAAFLVRTRESVGERVLIVPRSHAALVQVAAGLTVLTLAVGVLTTASGPHSGDDAVSRHLLDPALMAHVHSFPGYALLAAMVVVVITAAVHKLPTLRWSVTMLAVLVVQVLVGVYQARMNLPALSVGVHMVLAGLAAAGMTVLVMRVKVPAADLATREQAAKAA